jgi:hypothetical protein
MHGAGNINEAMVVCRRTWLLGKDCKHIPTLLNKHMQTYSTLLYS